MPARGAIPDLRVLFKSLGGSMGSYGGLQFHMGDLLAQGGVQ